MFSRKRASRRRRSARCAPFRSEILEPRIVLSATYDVADLGVLADTDASVATDLNNHGVVVGYASRSGLFPQTKAFQYDANTGLQDLGTLGGNNAGAVAINDHGQITGWAHDANDKQRGFRHDPGQGMVDLGGLGTNAGVYPADININGDVVGGSYYNGMGVGFIYTDANGMEINTPATTTASRSTRAINDQGDVAVFSSARSWITGTGGGFIDDNYPTALNNSQVATGSSDPFGRTGELFRHSAGNGSELLGTLAGGHTIGHDVNELGTIVGEGDLSNGSSHALVYTDADGMIDLNHLVSPDVGWELISASAINDAGQIVGTGLINGAQRAVLLSPFSGADTAVPLASLDSFSAPTTGASDLTFSVAYWDRSGIDVGTVDGKDIVVRALDGTRHAAAHVATTVSVDAVRLVVDYRISLPTSFGAKDNGIWTVAAAANEVLDTKGDAVVAGDIGTFDINIAHVVTSSISGPAISQANVTDTFTLDATTS